MWLFYIAGMEKLFRKNRHPELACPPMAWFPDLVFFGLSFLLIILQATRKIRLPPKPQILN